MASKNILTHYNFEGNEIQNVSLQKLVTDPEGANLKNGMFWVNITSKLLKYNDNGTVRTLIWGSGLGSGQTIFGGNDALGTLTLQSTTHGTKGSILIPEFNVAGFVKNAADGSLSGGNSLSAADIPAHSSASTTYGVADTSNYGHVKIGDGIAVSSGIISVDVGTGLELNGTSPNKKVQIDSTVVTLTGTQTLSGKTLTAPKFVNTGYIADANGNELIKFLTGSNAVNELTLINAATGSAPNLSATGGDTNINFILGGKGTGVVMVGSESSENEVATIGTAQTLSSKTLTAPKFADGGYIADASSNEMLMFDSVASAKNYIKITNAAASASPSINSAGDDTNIDLILYSKGTGTVKAGGTDAGNEVVTLSGTQTLTNKTLTTPTISTTGWANANHSHQGSTTGGTLDHGLALTGLSDDDHTQYVLLAGRSGGQVIYGGTAAGNNLTLRTTSNVTKGSYSLPDLTSSRVVKTDASSNLVADYIVSTDLSSNLLSTETDLGGTGASDTKISSQKAIKTYVDNAVTGFSWKEAAHVATTGNITLSGTQTIDGIALSVGQRVLVKDQTDKKTNGIYVVSSGAWSRASDADTAAELAKATIFVEAGSTQANTGWTCSNSSITEWTTDIEFSQFSGSGTYTGGIGIDIIGNDIRIDSSVVTTTGAQTLTNKTLTDNVIVSLYQNSGKTNKITFPAVTDTVVTLAAEQTLTNKTLTSPTLTTPRFANNGYIADSNGNELLMFGVTSSAVTYLKLTNNISDTDVVLAALGSTNAGLNITSSGTGSIKVNGSEVVTLSGTQTLTNKTLTTPTIGDFTNSQHNHTNAAGGGTLTDAALSSAVTTAKGGTGLTSYTKGDILYSDNTNSLAKLAGNTTTDRKVLTQTGTGSASAAPAWVKFTHEEEIGNGVDTDYIVTHNLGTRGVKISVWRSESPYDEIDYYAEKTSTNSITLKFNRAITANEFTVSISI